MHLRIGLFIFFISFRLIISAQPDNTLFTINGKATLLDEFERAFSKQNKIGISDNKDTTRKFLNQFIEFKLMVLEAKKLRLDKKREFGVEVQTYRKELIQPYLTDKQTIDKLAKEAYERMKTEIHTRHILVRVSPLAAPKDTLLAYQKAQNIKKRLINGENFKKLASEVSDDYSASVNGGDLWYVRPFMLPYSIENYLYKGKHSKFSAPLRSELGYHIVEILDKRPSAGKIKVAHIMVSLPKDTSQSAQDKAKKKIDELYRRLINGEDFKQLALEFSDDKGTSLNGGELPWFETGSTVHEFENASYQLQFDGAISKPLKTKYGWHIIKRISRENLPSFEQMEEQITKKIANSERGKLAKEKVLKKIKNDYQFTDYRALSPILDIVDSTIFDANWKSPEFLDLDGKLFTFNSRVYYQKDFVKYLESTQIKMFPLPFVSYINLKYNEFIEEALFKFKAAEIEKKNKEISVFLNEFAESKLVFEIMEQEVWTKAKNNKNGLSNFYSKNKSDYNKLYQADVSIFKYTTELKKVEKQFKKLKKQRLPDDVLETKIKASVDIGFKFVGRVVKEEGQNKIVDKVIKQYKTGELKRGVKFLAFENEQIIVWLNNDISKTNKTLEEVKEQVLTDYQKYVEASWLQKLKNKYQPEINESVFESIFN